MSGQHDFSPMGDGPILKRARWRPLRLFTGVIAVTMVLVAGLLAYNYLSDRITDRSGPVLLQSIQDLSRFEAATGNFEVIVDIEKDKPSFWDFIYSERVLFIAVGSVDVYVDFTTIGTEAIAVAADGKSVAITLPKPALEKANLDNSKSHIYDVDKGLVNAVGDIFNENHDLEQQAYLDAEQKIEQAAKDSGLQERAETNTRHMLAGLLGALGFQTVTVTFASAPD